MATIKQIDRQQELRISFWSIAAMLHRLDGLQEFARTVKPNKGQPGIKRTAQILAYAQKELNKLIQESQ
jgi:hypothetical protein